MALFYPYIRYIPEAVNKRPPTWPWQRTTLPALTDLLQLPPGWRDTLMSLMDVCTGPAEARPQATEALELLASLSRRGNVEDSNGETQLWLGDPLVRSRRPHVDRDIRI